MQTPSKHDRVRNIYQMLFEMANGNFNFRLTAGNNNDELDELSKVLNSISAAMRQTILDSGYIIPHFSYQSLAQVTIILNQDFIIENLSSNITDILGYSPEMLLNVDFTNILSIQSVDLWLQIKSETLTDDNYHNTLQFLFLAANQQIVPTFCTISRLLYSDKIFISSDTTILQNAMADMLGIANHTSPRPSESQLIQDVHDYILNHLEEPLPTIKELSRIFSTNEFRIKDGFRHFFNTSVYQFYNDERLKKAHLLIQLTNEPLKTIAFSCGYNDYVNFYKSFKKRFGYSPSDLLRPDIS